MIISRQKEFDEILHTLTEKNIFVIGCGKCAAKIRAGGEPEVLEMEKELTRAGKEITGWTVLSNACYIKSWEEVTSENPGILRSEAILVMSCGGGVSVISRLAGARVYPALDTESVGGVCNDRTEIELCNMCGDCTVWMYGGVCPITGCAKGLLNGPCGGALDGKCEVDERDCVWDEILEQLKKKGKIEYLEINQQPKDHTKRLRRKKK